MVESENHSSKGNGHEDEKEVSDRQTGQEDVRDRPHGFVCHDRVDEESIANETDDEYDDEYDPVHDRNDYSGDFGTFFRRRTVGA